MTHWALGSSESFGGGLGGGGWVKTGNSMGGDKGRTGNYNLAGRVLRLAIFVQLVWWRREDWDKPSASSTD